MRADSDEQRVLHSPRNRFPLVELVLALGIIAGLMYFWYAQEPAKTVESAVRVPSIPAPMAKTELPPTPDIPQRSEPIPVAAPDTSAISAENVVSAEQTEPVPATPATPTLATFEEGNELLLQQLALAGADASLDILVKSENPLETSAALIDGLSRGVILRKIFPASPPGNGFSVKQEGKIIYMDPVSYMRFDGLADTVSSFDSNRLVDTFHALRSLYESAYTKLGLDTDDFDNAVIRTLDLVLATPEIGEPIALQPKSVFYVYADPALESLPALQKQLLRMGPDNIRRIKQQAQALRDKLLPR